MSKKTYYHEKPVSYLLIGFWLCLGALLQLHLIAFNTQLLKEPLFVWTVSGATLFLLVTLLHLYEYKTEVIEDA